MLYNNFIVCMMTCALFALWNMIENQEWHYIILPIGILIWGFFKFFDEDDREYLKSIGIDPDKYNAFFPELSEDAHTLNRHKQTVSSSYPSRKGNTITWGETDTFDSSLYGSHRTSIGSTIKAWQNPAYKGMVKKCKRNFKISVREENEHDKQKRKSSIFTNASFGCG